MNTPRPRLLAAIFFAALLAPSPLSAKDKVDWLVELAGNVEHNALRQIDLPGARAKLVEAGRNIHPEKIASFDRCVSRKERRSLADTVAIILGCARFAKLSDPVKAEREEEFARLIVASSGFPQDKFLNAAETEELLTRTSPANGVVGLALTANDGRIAVVRSFRGSPARDAGIGSGWQLLSMDGKHYSGADRDEAARALAGEIGSTISLGLVDPQGMTREIVLERIKAAQIDWDVDSQRAGETLTVQVYEFAHGTSKKVEALIKNEGNEPSRIVLDLRGNVGGSLDEAIILADKFLDHGKIATVSDRRGGLVYNANPASIVPNSELIVLVDGDTAAGAELFAAALTDNGRATVLGEPTRGVGTVRTISRYRRDAAVVLTTEEIIRPSGDPLEGRGVLPEGPAWP